VTIGREEKAVDAEGGQSLMQACAPWVDYILATVEVCVHAQLATSTLILISDRLPPMGEDEAALLEGSETDAAVAPLLPDSFRRSFPADAVFQALGDDCREGIWQEGRLRRAVLEPSSNALRLLP